MKVWNNALHIFLCALPSVLFCISGGSMMLPLAAAVFLHECAHLAALRLCGGRIRSLRPAPFGLCIVYDENSVSLGGELLVSVAGCAVNIGSAVLSLLLYWLLHIDILNFGIVSLLAAALNLLPVQPLDGGRLVYLVLSAWRGPDFAGRVTATCTYLAAFPVFLLASYLLLTGQAGIYPLLFSIFLFSVNARALEQLIFVKNEE